MNDIDLQIEQIESAREELKKHFGEYYELSALTHTVPLLEELKDLRKYKDRADGRLNTLEEIQSKMISLHTDMIFRYGVDIVEARADAFDELKDWLKEQNK